MPVDAYHDDETGGEHLYADKEEEVLDDTYGQKWMEDPASRTFSEKNYGRALQMISARTTPARASSLRSAAPGDETSGAARPQARAPRDPRLEARAQLLRRLFDELVDPAARRAAHEAARASLAQWESKAPRLSEAEALRRSIVNNSTVRAEYARARASAQESSRDLERFLHARGVRADDVGRCLARRGLALDRDEVHRVYGALGGARRRPLDRGTLGAFFGNELATGGHRLDDKQVDWVHAALTHAAAANEGGEAFTPGELKEAVERADRDADAAAASPICASDADLAACRRAFVASPELADAFCRTYDFATPVVDAIVDDSHVPLYEDCLAPATHWDARRVAASQRRLYGAAACAAPFRNGERDARAKADAADLARYLDLAI
ncbi:hypothetical protein JL720_3599 [Aureococcus anophagefferens]|nr:hypothetical protein JL720_3599 [Aureococcus anophagefferens]